VREDTRTDVSEKLGRQEEMSDGADAEERQQEAREADRQTTRQTTGEGAGANEEGDPTERGNNYNTRWGHSNTRAAGLTAREMPKKTGKHPSENKRERAGKKGSSELNRGETQRHRTTSIAASTKRDAKRSRDGVAATALGFFPPHRKGRMRGAELTSEHEKGHAY
jgi:hypothetical protein